MIFAVLLAAQFVSYDAFSQRHEQYSEWAGLGVYAEDNGKIVSGEKRNPEVVLFGDSIVELWMKYRPEFFDIHNFAGRGISGQTTYQFLVRFRQDVVELKPDVVVIMAGTNDIAENIGPYCEENTLANINTMVDIAEANGIRAVLSSVLPAGGFLWNRAVTDAPERIARLNGKIKACAEERGLDFIDFHSEMIQGADGAGNRDSNHGVSVKDGFSVSAMNPEYTEDGVHPLPEGYEVMERILLRHIVSVEGENNR